MAREILLSLKAQLRVPIAVFFFYFFSNYYDDYDDDILR